MDDNQGKPRLDIFVPSASSVTSSVESQIAVRGKIQNLLMTILGSVFMFDDPEHVMTKMFRDDLALIRSLDFTGSAGPIHNILGDNPRLDISHWLEHEGTDYPLLRDKPWDHGVSVRGNVEGVSIEADRSVDAAKKPTSGAIQESRVKHSDIEHYSFIRSPLWDHAKWSGTAFIRGERDGDRIYPPMIAPIFLGKKAAEEIFALWKAELGGYDAGKRMRIAIVRGIDRKNPFAYRVLFGTNLTKEMKQRGGLAILTHRIHTMTPASNVNLDLFLKDYRDLEAYLIAFCILQKAGAEPRLVLDSAIMKSDLVVKEAWEIGRNDPDSVAIKKDDKPIIPAGETNVPVLELLRWKQKQEPA